MNCNTELIKDLFLGELKGANRLDAEKHLTACPACSAEWDRLQLTRAALFSIPQEEPPRRIAFVSDKVFEPAWYQRLFQSGPAMGLASAAMLSIAIFAHSFRPVPAAAPAAGINTSQVQAIVQAEVERRLDSAVTKAVAATQADGERKAAALVAATEQRLLVEHRADLLAVQETMEVMRKRMNVMYTASADLGGR
jgi:anti-sigma factor RsiW